MSHNPQTADCFARTSGKQTVETTAQKTMAFGFLIHKNEKENKGASRKKGVMSLSYA